MDVQAKTINLLLYGGTLQNVISLEDSGWNAGIMYVSSRNSIDHLLETDACSRLGIYLLLSSDKVHVGQSSDLRRRLTQHLSGRDWWESALVITTTDDSLDHTDIDYLESLLIDMAMKAAGVNCDNATKENLPKVSKFREVYLGQFLHEALFLMELTGITVFSGDSSVHAGNMNKPAMPSLSAMSVQERLALGVRNKAEALAYVKEHGVSIASKVTYATYKDSGGAFWANPRSVLLQQDFQLVLNDTMCRELIVIRVPAGTVGLRPEDPQGLYTRSDLPNKIELRIDRVTLTDRMSGFSFLAYVVARVGY